MSHHSDDALLIVGSDSFWEPGNYKRTTKRVEDSFRLCNDLILLIQERSEIEKTYAKSLRNWSKKWNEIIEKGPEYGTTEAAWKAVLIEADRRCDMHLRIKDQLLNDVITQIKQWQKDNFHKSMMQLKEKKEMEDSFKKAQKPWSKLLARVNKAKADYHQACKNERSAVNQERNASADTSLSPDQVTKLQDRVTKCKYEAQRAKERYEQALEEINDYNAKYMEDMTVVFDKCQEFEEKRLDFFKEMLFAIHRCLNISTDAELPQIYEEYRHSIQNADAKKDLKWWSNNHGVGMPMNWPQFEDYCEEFRDIGKLKKGAVPESGILLVNQQKIGEDLPEFTSESQNVSKKEKRGTLSNDGVKMRPEKSKPSSNRNSAINFQKLPNNPFEVGDNEAFEDKNTNGKQEQNPFDDDQDQEEWDEGSNEALVDTGEPGVPVRALYDYEGAEDDELSFKNGEVFEKLEDEDEQGWCKGRKDGKVGLYPASYVEVIAK
ncbi:protein kinase C and casein kinase substrate in neurons protein 1-like isoform X1 [Argiope bruennichi]|uniref:Protein kinase C and casein kinase substrate like protein n=1 Tax=Argiope bruennichi TaxID=94029 RepID=A0A8T0FCN2_ARGBR|nr:protein kinase C and casein kinase substrate in neurons protein 1-like isoform X1 [Argiope bruennichi]XP_055941026.1 protein kinase C and casein kinase substrate in neurons protein 1-like isoform X1 [Argiope bruennichi]XP_055941027.1 protein kinase C and casein kinase substrate in neurons protein 1-like isoform X1 [Argiope bruennichi]XP_055941028.1 protein kinase C and casein kinase substrate in neurons protein 1-like isoform X1 [Argiope bruennichi]KAF8786693.1 Protein kinase C and casein ki